MLTRIFIALTFIVALAALVLATIALFAQRDTPVAKTSPAEYTRAFVADAVRYYKENGRGQTVAYYNSQESVDGDWYIFIADENDVLIVHPTIPSLIGEPLDSPIFVDASGYHQGKALTATTGEGQWVDYLSINPATGQGEVKHTWAIRHDGYIFGSGWYERHLFRPPQTRPAEYTRAYVTEAIQRYALVGKEDAFNYYNSMESVDGQWFLFVVGPDDTMLVHPAVPEKVGHDLKGPVGTDSRGNNFGAQILSTDGEGQWVDYYDPNPARGNKEELKHAWAVKYDDYIFGSGWYESEP